MPVEKTHEVEVSLGFLPYFFAPLDVNRNSTIKIGRRLSKTLELYTEKWDGDEEKSLRLPYLCFSTYSQQRAKPKLEKSRAEIL